MSLTRRNFLKVSGGLVVSAHLPGWAVAEHASPNIPIPDPFDWFPTVIVMGVGGTGGTVVNALARHPRRGIVHVDVRADGRGLALSRAPVRLLLGPRRGRSLCPNQPEDGRRAALEKRRELLDLLEGADLLLLVGGLGGGTTSGALPVIARLAGEAGATTIGVITQPFGFEGPRRRQWAAEALSRLERVEMTTVTVPLDVIADTLASTTTLETAYQRADETLATIARAISEIITVPGHINVGLSDLRATLAHHGRAAVGIGVGSSPSPEVAAATAALDSSALGESVLANARGVLVHFRSDAVNLQEVTAAMETIQSFVRDDAAVLYTDTPDPSFGDRVEVTVIVA